MKKFNKEIAFDYVLYLCHEHNIKPEFVLESKGWIGLAYVNERIIFIPEPLDIELFSVCLHEINHVIQGSIKPRYLEEFRCEIFAIQEIESMGYDTTLIRESARRYIIYHLSTAFNNGLKIDSIPHAIKLFCEIDFTQWEGKIYVSNYDLDSIHMPFHIWKNNPTTKTLYFQSLKIAAKR